MGQNKNRSISSNTSKIQRVLENGCILNRCVNNFEKNSVTNTLSKSNKLNNGGSPNLSLKSDKATKLKIHNKHVTNISANDNSSNTLSSGYAGSVTCRNFYENLPVYQRILKSSGTQTPFISLDDSLGIISHNEENCNVCSPEFVKIFKKFKSMTCNTIDISTQPLSETPNTEDEFKIYKLYYDKIFSHRHNRLMLFNNDLLNIAQEFHKKDKKLVSVGVQKNLSKDSLLCSKCSFALKHKKELHNLKEQHRIIKKLLINSLISNTQQGKGKIRHNKKENIHKDVQSSQSSSKSKTKEKLTVQTQFPNRSKIKNVKKTKQLIGDDILDLEKLRNEDKYGKFIKGFQQDCSNSFSSGTTCDKISLLKSPTNRNKTDTNKNKKANVEIKKKLRKLATGDNTKKKINNSMPKYDNDPMSAIVPIERNLNKRKLKHRKYAPKSRHSIFNPNTDIDATKSVSGEKSRVISNPNSSMKNSKVLPLNAILKNRNIETSMESEQKLDKLVSNTKLGLQKNIVEKIENSSNNRKMNWTNDFRKIRPRSAGRKVESEISRTATINTNTNEMDLFRKMALDIHPFLKESNPFYRNLHRSSLIKPNQKLK